MPPASDLQPANWMGASRNAVPGYDIPGLHVTRHRLLDMPIRTSSLRSLGAHLNVFAIESFMDELAAAAGTDPVRMAGVAMNTTVLGRALVEPDSEPIFAELNSRGAVLYLHPAGNSACSPLIGNYHLTWMVGAPVEDTISVMHLITHGIPARYPDIKIINSHLGGALPMLLQRADDQYRWEAPDTPEPPSVAARRMWYDTVGHGHVPALRCAIDSLGADRFLLGTDFPYENGDIFVRAVDYINDPQIDPSAARAILDQNASALLGIG